MSITPAQLKTKGYNGIFFEIPDLADDLDLASPCEDIASAAALAWMDAAAQILAMSGVAFPGDWLASLTNYAGLTVEAVAADIEHPDMREGALADFFVNAEDKVAARAKIRYVGEIMFRYERLINRKAVSL